MSANEEYTGGSVSYYKVLVTDPTSGGDAYTAECNDIIKYSMRAGRKDGTDDAAKALHYAQKLREVQEA